MKSSEIGKQHLLAVSSILKSKQNSQNVEEYHESAIQTAAYIDKMFPDIIDVKNRYDFKNPNQSASLVIKTKQKEIAINLHKIKGNGKVQPKNLGARSFLKKYFQDEYSQILFNNFLDDSYKYFVIAVIETRTEPSIYGSMKELKKQMEGLYPTFNENIKSLRRRFLFDIRESCYRLLKQLGKREKIYLAYKNLMMVDQINIVTRETKKGCKVELWAPEFDENKKIHIYRKGNDSVGIRIGHSALLLRFKFESGPNSSIKIATSYDIFPIESEFIEQNRKTIKDFEGILSKHYVTSARNTSNAIGKCNEAMVYYQLLNQHQDIQQIEQSECIDMLNEYANNVRSEVLKDIQTSSITTIQSMERFLVDKYTEYKIEAIHLVPESYIKDRLDTSDLHLVLTINDKQIDQYFSLKAVARKGSKITMKNPGIGTILGDQFFRVGSMSPFVQSVKERFIQKKIDHHESIDIISEELGQALVKANQQQLKQGVEALFGVVPTIVTFYKMNESVVKKHSEIDSHIKVFIKTPTSQNTTLAWNDNLDSIILRVKFSAGQSKGWSSIKLACEYKVH